MLIVFDDVIADTESNKTVNRIVTVLFLRGRKLNMPLVFISKPYFKVHKAIRLNGTKIF